MCREHAASRIRNGAGGMPRLSCPNKFLRRGRYTEILAVSSFLFLEHLEEGCHGGNRDQIDTSVNTPAVTYVKVGSVLTNMTEVPEYNTYT